MREAVDAATLKGLLRQPSGTTDREQADCGIQNLYTPDHGQRSTHMPAEHQVSKGAASVSSECSCAHAALGVGSGERRSAGFQNLPDSLNSKLSVLSQPRALPEHTGLVNWVRANIGTRDWGGCVPQATSAIRSLTNVVPTLLSQYLNGLGEPVVVTDAFRDWPALSKWTWDFWHGAYGSELVTVNDRAPARHADAHPGGGGRQRSVQLPLKAYLEYMQARRDMWPEQASEKRKYLRMSVREGLPETIEDMADLGASWAAPFYLNGWRAFSAAPQLLQDCPGPYFATAVDNSELTMAAVEKTLFRQTTKSAATSPHPPTLTSSLTKVFMGLPGTITRTHYDAANAHGWLGQVVGRKLFIMYSPNDTPWLYPIPGELETQQSDVDPLAPGVDGAHPLYVHARPLAIVLEAGQAIVIPKGWWHYAVALDRSLTVMRNFYSAGDNAVSMVKLVLKVVSEARSQKQAIPKLG